MHRLSTTFVLGYHGCDRRDGIKLVGGKSRFRQSENDYDWLGPGTYFWEANPERAMQFAMEKKDRGQGTEQPFAVGAVIDLGLCLDLAATDSIRYLRSAYGSLKSTTTARGLTPPENGPQSWERYLDCAVIRRLHRIIKDQGFPRIDTVRGVFQEGKPMYPGSAFFEKTHTQIAVLNPDCIKAVFHISKS